MQSNLTIAENLAQHRITDVLSPSIWKGFELNLALYCIHFSSCDSILLHLSVVIVYLINLLNAHKELVMS
jgi:hypothetical protein